MKKLLVVSLCFIICISFSGCCLMYDYQSDAIDNFDVGYSKMLNNAFLSTYNWDGINEIIEIVVPEEYNGIPITEFGGYFGSGVPCSFIIEPTDSAKEKLCDKSDEWFHMLNIQTIKIEEIKTINFNIHISRNIEKIENLDLGGFFGCCYIKDGEECYNVFVVLCTITCDNENKSFYAEDGKLYFREDDALVTGILYYDFDIDEYMKEESGNTPLFAAF